MEDNFPQRKATFPNARHKNIFWRWNLKGVDNAISIFIWPQRKAPQPQRKAPQPQRKSQKPKKTNVQIYLAWNWL